MSSKFIIMMIYLAFHFHHISSKKDNCILSSACRLAKVNTIIDASGIERIVGKDRLGLQCDIHEGFSFAFNHSEYEITRCLDDGSLKLIIELRWPKHEEKATLYDGLNISNLILFINLFYDMIIHLVNVKRFGCNIANFDQIAAWEYRLKKVFCFNCKLDFYTNGKTL